MVEKYMAGYTRDNLHINFVDDIAQRKLEILRESVRQIISQLSDLSSNEELQKLANQIEITRGELENYKAQLEIIKDSFKDLDEETDDFQSDLNVLATLPKSNFKKIEENKNSIKALTSRIVDLEKTLESINLPSLEKRVADLEALNLTTEKVKFLENLIEATGLVVDAAGSDTKYQFNIKKIDGLSAEISDEFEINK